MYIHRQIESQIKPFIKRKEVVGIIGPRQAGKTTLLKQLEKELSEQGKKVKFITFEDRNDLNLFQKSIDDFKKIAIQFDCVIIDEFQYAKNGGQKLKYLYDTTKIKFIISGSSSLELTFQTGKYMMGRMVEFTLLPFSFKEFLSINNQELLALLKTVGDPLDFDVKNGFGQEINKRLADALEEYAIFGGYPAVALSPTNEEKQKLLQSIEEKYLLKDIKSLLNLATEDELTRLEKFLAGQIGGMIKYEELSRVSGLDYRGLKKHLRILEKTYITSYIKPYFTNKRTELAKNPKVYFIDLGLRNYSLTDFRPFYKRNDAGALMENYAFNLLSILYPEIKIKYWRTKSKAEVDFIIEKNQQVYPVEIKYSSKKTIGKSFYSFLEKFKPSLGVIFTRDYLAEEKIKGTKVKFIPLSYF